MPDCLSQCLSPRRIPVALVITALLFSSPALASSDTAPPQDILRGPSVVDEGDSARGLPSRGFDGEMAPPQGRPELVVLRSLELGDDERAATEAILAERGVEIRRLVAEHTDLLIELQTLRQAGDRQAVRRRLMDMREAARPLTTPPLADRLAEALTEPNSTAFRSRLETLRQSMRAERMGSAMQDDRRPPARTGRRLGERPGLDRSGPDRTPVRGPGTGEFEELLGVVQEMGQTLREELEFGRTQIDAFLERIEATPEQAERIRTIFRDGALDRDPSARARAFAEVMRELTPDQRRAALRAVREM